MKAEHLTKAADFARVFSKSGSVVNDLIVLKTLPNSLPHSRFGITVGRRVGGAVVRNRVKRRLRELFRRLRLITGWDIVIIARPAAAVVEYSVLKDSVNSLLSKARLISVDTNLQGSNLI